MILRAAAAGALIVGIPMAGVISYERQQAEQAAENLSYYEQLHAQYSHARLYVLTKDAVAGQELTSDMLSVQQIQSEEDLSGTAAVQEEDLLGKRLKVSLAKGTALHQDLVYEGAAVTDDERQVEVSELIFPELLREDEFVDIRIVFPNGEDYLVVGQKRVYEIIHDSEGKMQALQLRFSEEELLRYQAACVDTQAYQNTRLYALRYTGEYQKAGEVYYPVNPEVFQLLQWDPNIADLFVVEEEQERRAVLEKHIAHYLLDESEETQEKQAADTAAEQKAAEETKEPLTLYTGLPEET